MIGPFSFVTRDVRSMISCGKRSGCMNDERMHRVRYLLGLGLALNIGGANVLWGR